MPSHYNLTPEEEDVLRAIYYLGDSSFEELSSYTEIPRSILASILSKLIVKHKLVRGGTMLPDGKVKYELTNTGYSYYQSLPPSRNFDLSFLDR